MVGRCNLNQPMKKLASILAIIGVLALVALSVSVQAQSYPQRKIVVFKSGVLNEPARDRLVERVGGIKVKNLDLIGAKSVLLPHRAAERALLASGAVLRIDDDVVVTALEEESEAVGRKGGDVGALAQSLPWGIDRIDAELVWPITQADTVKVGVIDTGISLSHPDLAANIKGQYNAINPKKSANDDNGHGSHVAGIIAALNNSIGVVGAGPLIDLYAIKVLNRNGSGFLSDVIEGIDVAIQRDLDVINLSLGTYSNVQSFHDAIIRAKAAGLVVVAAAGNSGGAVIYPAAYPEAIAVSATDSNNVIASFSSRGPEVDLAAPGVSIYSTYKGTGYKTLSGTSMAAPHAAGSAALLLSTSLSNPGLCDTITVNGSCDPDEVQAKLQSSAVDLGASGRDDLYGWGLVNAWRTTQ